VPRLIRIGFAAENAGALSRNSRKEFDQFPGTARMVGASDRKLVDRSCGVRATGLAVDGTSHRSFMLGISLICGQASEKEDVKNGRSKKYVKGTILFVVRSVSSVPRAMISGMMKVVAKKQVCQ